MDYNSTKVDYTKFFKVEPSEPKPLFYFEKDVHQKYGEVYVRKCRLDR